MTLSVGVDPEEAKFLAEYDPSRFPPIAVSVDTVALNIRDGELCVLAIQRARPPFKGYWGLPGRFVKPDQSLGAAALDGLNAKTNVLVGWMEQLATFGEMDRDPRMRVVSVAYLAFGPTVNEPSPGYHADDVDWIPVFKVPVGWAFDHGKIVKAAIERAQSKLEYTPLATRFLPREFTITDLRRVYETVWNRPLDPGNFHRKVKGTTGLIVPTGKRRGSARLYRAGDAGLIYPPIRREAGDWS